MLMLYKLFKTVNIHALLLHSIVPLPGKCIIKYLSTTDNNYAL